ncbi:MAG: tetratricopeptide repeat protein [Deltaproteobacteria bacterium]|nr:tetratricopeptide repeat protein [Deltaproteobacteria bacterium]
MSKRLEAIQKMLAAGNRDPFTRYALALELKSLGRNDESLAAFEELRAADPSYVPQYLMAGGVAEALEKNDEALRWYDEGIAAARAKGDSHALSELEQARAAASSK